MYVMAAIQIFNNDRFGQVRIQMDASGEPLFCANDICIALGYSNYRDAIVKHVDEEDVAKCDTLTKGGNQVMTYVNESGLYSLIFGSKLESAKQFKKWVTSEVLPSIRKTGGYSVNTETNPKREPSLTTKVRIGIEWVKGVSDTLNLNDASKLSLLSKIAEPLGLPLPDYAPSKGILKSAKALLAENNVPISTQVFNRTMIERGLITEATRPSSHGEKKYKSITKKGLRFGENQVNPQNPKETQPLYYVDLFPELLREVGILPN